MLLEITRVGNTNTIFVPAVKAIKVDCSNNCLIVTLKLMNNNEKVIPEIEATEGVTGVAVDYRQHIHDMHIHIADGYSISYVLPR